MRRVLLTASSMFLAFSVLSGALDAAKTPSTYDIADGDVPGLIAAIEAANAAPGPDTISLAPGGHYAVVVPYDPFHDDSTSTGNGLPSITDELTINGNGATIARSSDPDTADFRLIQIWFGATLTMSSVTISNGRHMIMGAGVMNFGTLTLRDSTIAGNWAHRYGGGIFSWPGTTLTMTGSTIANNIADDFNANGCHSCSYGGGIDSWGVLIVVNSTISHNLTGFSGGGLYTNGTLSLVNSTIDHNRSLNSAGGLAVDSSGIVNVVNTILSSNTGGSGSPTNCTAIGSVVSLGHNLSTDGTCVSYFGQAGDMNNTPAGLDPAGLQDNGGPTETIALVTGSAAIDAGDDAACASPPVNSLDQRGAGRPAGSHCDIGAFEAAVADGDAPILNCASPDGLWHAADVSLLCTATDEGSGLQNAGDASFFLSTNVAAGAELSNAQTGSHVVCDNDGNCATAGPIGGNMIDKRAPTVSIAAPATVTYMLNQVVAADFACADAGSGVSSCLGSVASGSPLDTSTVGTHTLAVVAADVVGQTTTKSVTYTVTYNHCALFDSSKAHKSGSTIPIKLQLCDAAGANVSSASVPLTATGVYLVSTSAPGPLADSGNANPDYQFRFADGQYIFNLSLKGFSQGTYALAFTAAGDPTSHTVQFQVK